MPVDPSTSEVRPTHHRVAWPRSAQTAAAVLIVAALAALAGFAWRPGRSAVVSAPAALVDLNRASRAELLLLPGIGEQMAERIEAYRTAHGPFRSADDLRKIPGIGPATLDRLRPWVAVQANAPNPELAGIPLIQPKSIEPDSIRAKPASVTEPMNLNSATADELQRLPGIGPKLAKRIFDERLRKPFVEVADLRRVPGIGPKTLEKVRPFVTIAP